MAPKFEDESIKVRYLMQGADYYVHQKVRPKEPMEDFGDPDVKWAVQSTKESKNVSALGLFFCNYIAEKAGIPVGMVCIAANGAQIQELMSKDKATSLKLKTSNAVGVGGYFNGIVAPLLGISFKGMIFFQGESESGSEGTAKKYSTYLTAYVDDMKEKFGFDFPFYDVQLSNYTEKCKQYGFYNIHFIRMEQYDAMQQMGNENLIASYDLGSPPTYFDFIHSPKKKELAERIGNLALAKEYGIGNKDDYLSPTPETVTLSEDKTTVTIKFKNVGDGLVSKSGTASVKGFALGKQYAKKVDAEAEIVSADTVVIKVPEGANTSYVSYGFTLAMDDTNAQLYTSNGLPALAFNFKLG